VADHELALHAHQGTDLLRQRAHLLALAALRITSACFEVRLTSTMVAEVRHQIAANATFGTSPPMRSST
jgi:hypothetical protein